MMSFFMDLVFLSEGIGSHAYFKPTLFFETGSNYVAQARLKAVDSPPITMTSLALRFKLGF